MLTIALKDSCNPYDLAQNMLRAPKSADGTLEDIKVDIESGKVTFTEGDPSNSILNVIMLRPIKSVSNAKPLRARSSPIFSDSLSKISTTGTKIATDVYSTISTKNQGKTLDAHKVEDIQSETFTTRPKRMSLWMVDFGAPVGGEFGHPHPAILYEETSQGLWNVIPCSSKSRGKEALELSFQDPKVLKNKSPKFYAQPTTYVLFKERQSVSEKRFLHHLGDIAEGCYDLIERCYETGTYEENVPFTLEDLRLNEKQLKLLCGKENEAVEIGNADCTYEEKVRRLLNLLGFYPDVDEGATYLFEAIKRTKVLSFIDSDRLFVDLSKGKLIKPEVLRGKTTLPLKKKYKELYPCFEAFLRLINKIAFYH